MAAKIPIYFYRNKFNSTRTINYGLMPSHIGVGEVNDCANITTPQEEVSAFLRLVSEKHASTWCFSVSVPFYYSGKSATALYPWLINNTFMDAGYSNGGNKINYSGWQAALINNIKQTIIGRYISVRTGAANSTFIAQNCPPTAYWRADFLIPNWFK